MGKRLFYILSVLTSLLTMVLAACAQPPAEAPAPEEPAAEEPMEEAPWKKNPWKKSL